MGSYPVRSCAQQEGVQGAMYESCLLVFRKREHVCSITSTYRRVIGVSAHIHGWRRSGRLCYMLYVSIQMSICRTNVVESDRDIDSGMNSQVHICPHSLHLGHRLEAGVGHSGPGILG